MRDLMLDRGRFKDFIAPPEGISTNILSEGLERLLELGIVVRTFAGKGAKYFAYQLTAKGTALRPVLKAMHNWGLAWEPDT